MHCGHLRYGGVNRISGGKQYRVAHCGWNISVNLLEGILPVVCNESILQGSRCPRIFFLTKDVRVMSLVQEKAVFMSH